MTQLAQTFENPSAVDNTTLMTAGSGGNGVAGGDFPNIVPNASGTSTVFSQTQVMFGSWSMRLIPVASNRTGIEWTTSLGTLGTPNYHRLYMHKSQISVTKANELLIKAWQTAGGTANWTVERSNSIGPGALVIRDGAQTTVWGSGAVALSNSTWYRIEVEEVQGASGVITVRLYAGDSTTLLDTFNSGARNILATGDIMFCSDASDVTSYYDNIVAGATSWVGPTSSTVRITGTLGMRRPVVYS